MSDPVWLAIITGIQTVVVLAINKKFGDRRATRVRKQVQAVDDRVQAITSNAQDAKKEL